MSAVQRTQAQLFAAAYAADMAQQVLRTIKWVRWAATFIMVGAMLISYTHQAAFLHDIGMPLMAAWVVPGLFDALTFICVKVISTKGIMSLAARIAIKVIIFPVMISGIINFLGFGELIVKCTYVAVVILIPLAELVASPIKPDFRAMDSMEREASASAGTDISVSEEERQRRSEAGRKAAATRARSRGSKRDRIVELLTKHPGITVTEVAKLVKASATYVSNVRTELRKQGLLPAA